MIKENLSRTFLLQIYIYLSDNHSLFLFLNICEMLIIANRYLISKEIWEKD